MIKKKYAPIGAYFENINIKLNALIYEVTDIYRLVNKMLHFKNDNQT